MATTQLYEIVYASTRRRWHGPCSLYEAEKHLRLLGFRNCGKNLWCRQFGTSRSKVMRITAETTAVKRVSKKAWKELQAFLSSISEQGTGENPGFNQPTADAKTATGLLKKLRMRKL